MKSNSNLPILTVATLTAIMLLMVFVGESIPILFRTIAYAICVVGVMGILVLMNILSEDRAGVFRKLFGIGYLIMGGILVSIILFDYWFATGDSLRFGLEPGTALLVFGVTFFPFAFIILWVLGFERVVVTPEKELRLKRLTEEGEEQSNG